MAKTGPGTSAKINQQSSFPSRLDEMAVCKLAGTGGRANVRPKPTEKEAEP